MAPKTDGRRGRQEDSIRVYLTAGERREVARAAGPFISLSSWCRQVLVLTAREASTRSVSGRAPVAAK